MRKKEQQQSRKFDIQEFTDVCHALHLLNNMETLCQYYDMVELYETLQTIDGLEQVKIFVNRILSQSLGETIFSIEFTIDAISNRKILIHTKLDDHQRKFIFYAGNFTELLGITEESYLCIVVNDLETVMKHVRMLRDNYISFLFQVMQFNVQREKSISSKESYQYMLEAKTKFIHNRMTQAVFEVMEDCVMQKYDALCYISSVPDNRYTQWKVDITTSIHQAIVMYLSMRQHGYEAEQMWEMLTRLIYSKEKQRLLQESHQKEIDEATINGLHKQVDKILQEEMETWRTFYLNNHLDIDEKLLLRFDGLR